MMMVVVVMLVGDLLHQLVGQIVAALHGRDDLRAGQFIPRGGKDSGLGIVFPQHTHGGVKLGRVRALRAGEEDGACVLHLIVEELAKVFHVDTALQRVHHRHEAVQRKGSAAVPHAFHRGDHVGQLAHAGRLDDDPLGGVGGKHLAQRLAEVAHEGAADAAGVHLGNLDAGLLQETAVDADLAELVFDQDYLLALKCLGQQFFDQRGLARSQKAGDNVNFRHVTSDPFHLNYFQRMPACASRSHKSSAACARVVAACGATSPRSMPKSPSSHAERCAHRLNAA